MVRYEHLQQHFLSRQIDSYELYDETVDQIGRSKNPFQDVRKQIGNFNSPTKFFFADYNMIAYEHLDSMLIKLQIFISRDTLLMTKLSRFLKKMLQHEMVSTLLVTVESIARLIPGE